MFGAQVQIPSKYVYQVLANRNLFQNIKCYNIWPSTIYECTLQYTWVLEFELGHYKASSWSTRLGNAIFDRQVCTQASSCEFHVKKLSRDFFHVNRTSCDYSEEFFMWNSHKKFKVKLTDGPLYLAPFTGSEKNCMNLIGKVSHGPVNFT